MPIMALSHLLHTPAVKTDITRGTFKQQFIARATTFVTRREVLSLMNKSEEMLVDCRCVCAPKLNILVSQLHTNNTLQKYIWNEHDNYILHNSRTNALDLVLLHRYHNNIHLSRLQQYNEVKKDARVVCILWCVVA